jgi:predicted thioesterase
MALVPGLRASLDLTVTEADTATAYGSGDVPVLATPRIVALAEAACVAAVVGHLPAGVTTVGTRVELDHLAATPVGRSVRADAHLVAVDGRRLAFEVEVRDGDTTAAVGRVERVSVDRERFVARAYDSAPNDSA